MLGTSLALLILTGCASAAPEVPEPAATLPAGAFVELQQLRSDVAGRQAQVHLVNDGDAPLTVREVRVEDDRFDGPAARVMEGRVSTVAPGSSVDIRVQLPPVDCTAPDDGEARVVLELVEDSDSTEVTASASDPLGFVAELHARECLLERVTDAASLVFSDFEPSAPGAPAALDLTVTPTGGGALTVSGIGRTNLIDFAGPTSEEVHPLGVEVAEGDAEPVVVQIPIVPLRCDPHAVQEDKRGTIFDLGVELEGEAGEVELFVGEEMRGRILTWVAAWCGFGG
ncbi:hypothetical protein JNB63_08320 [Microbacterium trichothecenolyticum]|uniref:hypothetical protein n=1 Tax=Microbacterium trichothecenolyticum TaxID=69370 RepID=UPI001C6E0BF9|nr:hypothetical protein [Microbacterium trichothecenolyticum]MBW9120095.1 hypothetical protein [Microbacterium trichothecenolyticum]